MPPYQAIGPLVRIFAYKPAMLKAMLASFLSLALSCGPVPASADHSTPSAPGSVLIAIPEFATSSSQTAELAARIRHIIEERLSHLESYAVSDASGVTANAGLPNFSAWQSRRVQFLVLASIGVRDNGTLRLEARLWNIPAREPIVGQQFILSPADWERAADLIADEIVAHLNRRDLAPDK
jgi:hypothetical protein